MCCVAARTIRDANYDMQRAGVAKETKDDARGCERLRVGGEVVQGQGAKQPDCEEVSPGMQSSPTAVVTWKGRNGSSEARSTRM